VEIITPVGWQADPPALRVTLSAKEWQKVSFSVTAPEGQPVRRARVALDVTVGSRRFGQQAEALVDLKE